MHLEGTLCTVFKAWLKNGEAVLCSMIITVCVCTFRRSLLFHAVCNPNLQISNTNVCFEETKTAALSAPSTANASTQLAARYPASSSHPLCLTGLQEGHVNCLMQTQNQSSPRSRMDNKALNGARSSCCMWAVSSNAGFAQLPAKSLYKLQSTGLQTWA